MEIIKWIIGIIVMGTILSWFVNLFIASNNIKKIQDKVCGSTRVTNKDNVIKQKTLSEEHRDLQDNLKDYIIGENKELKKTLIKIDTNTNKSSDNHKEIHSIISVIKDTSDKNQDVINKIKATSAVDVSNITNQIQALAQMLGEEKQKNEKFRDNILLLNKDMNQLLQENKELKNNVNGLKEKIQELKFPNKQQDYDMEM